MKKFLLLFFFSGCISLQASQDNQDVYEIVLNPKKRFKSAVKVIIANKKNKSKRIITQWHDVAVELQANAKKEKLAKELQELQGKVAQEQGKLLQLKQDIAVLETQKASSSKPIVAVLPRAQDGNGCCSGR